MRGGARSGTPACLPCPAARALRAHPPLAVHEQEYEFKVQVPGKPGDEKMLTVGKAELDLARFAGPDRTEQPKLVPVMFKVTA